MRVERSLVLKAEPYGRSPERLGYAKGFKPKTVRTRLGQLELQVRQVRGGVAFYRSSLDRGLRSERAPKLAVGANSRPAANAGLRAGRNSADKGRDPG